MLLWRPNASRRQVKHAPENGSTATATDVRVLSHRQALFIGYFFCVLADLTVLNLFDEYFEPVNIDSITTSLFAAALLQLLLRLTLALEHRIANYFKEKGGKNPLQNDC